MQKSQITITAKTFLYRQFPRIIKRSKHIYGLLQRYWLTDLKICKISAKAKLWRPIDRPVVGATEHAMPKQASVQFFSFVALITNQDDHIVSVAVLIGQNTHRHPSLPLLNQSVLCILIYCTYLSIYSIFLLIEVCGGCTLKLSLICCRDGSETKHLKFLHFLNLPLIQPVLTPEV